MGCNSLVRMDSVGVRGLQWRHSPMNHLSSDGGPMLSRWMPREVSMGSKCGWLFVLGRRCDYVAGGLLSNCLLPV